MKQQKHSPKFLRQRKALLALPILIFPFLTLIFWSLGGGKAGDAVAAETSSGFNVDLPSASNKPEPLDKMGFYAQADKDSVELLKQLKNDPYYIASASGPDRYTASWYQDEERTSQGFRSASAGYGKGQANEAMVYEKLNELQTALKKAEEPSKEIAVEKARETTDPGISSDIERLEQMMLMMNQGSVADDPEMKQINGLLENILDIQHPERMQQKIRETSASHKGQVYAVDAIGKPDPVSTLSGNTLVNVHSKRNGFFSLGEINSDVIPEQPAIQAVIHETQTLVNGSTVKLRLTDGVYINGIYIPKDHFVFGIAALEGERLSVAIKSIRNGNSLFPVDLRVYDMDGLGGIYIPGAISRDVAKQSGERAAQSFGLTTLDPSLGAQAASAGIELTRNLLSKKIKLVKVQVKAGYQVLLRDEKQKQNN